LLVDDDPSAIRVMSKMLAEYPHQRFATSGEAALRLARESVPDLILLDVDMPGMTGLEVCDALKSDPRLADVPIIFATSHHTIPIELVALQKGAADFVTKPLIAAQLTARVRVQLRNGRFVEDLARERLAVGAALHEPSAQVPRLLIVDDDVAAIRILQHTLAGMGEVHFARSGEEALQLARSLGPQLVLLDAHMPDLDGFAVCAALKAEPAFEHVPVVFVTRFSDPRNETRALDLGAADFIAKPYTSAVLQARVRNLLELARRTAAELQAVREHWRRIGDARVADIVAGASEAIVSFDAAGVVVLANAAACRIFGVTSEQAVGVPIETLLGERPVAVASPAGPLRFMIPARDGGRFAAEASMSQVGEGASLLSTIMLRDISDRERLEAESHARIEAETASRTKTLMMSYIAHEMGNPLNGVLGMAHLMETDAVDPLPPRQAKRLGHVLTSGRRLEALLRDVLDLGRFETGKLTIDLVPIDVSACMEGAVAAVSSLAEQGGISLVTMPVPAPVRVIADAARLHQCLVNLLTNSIKYNRPNGSVRVEVRRDANDATLMVHDDGLGMNELQRQHLFEPFNRLGRQHAAMPGAGLGLVITRQLVEAMGGQLRVESEAGLGSCFSIIVPCAPDSASP
jgi:signal transduction histidine kinase